jgi:hypothetical protein
MASLIRLGSWGGDEGFGAEVSTRSGSDRVSEICDSARTDSAADVSRTRSLSLPVLTPSPGAAHFHDEDCQHWYAITLSHLKTLTHFEAKPFHPPHTPFNARSLFPA